MAGCFHHLQLAIGKRDGNRQKLYRFLSCYLKKSAINNLLVLNVKKYPRAG